MAKKVLFNDDPSWTYEPVLLPDGSRFYNRYFYKRKRAHRIPLDEPKAEVLSGYVLIEKDLRSCKIWLESIIKMASSDERHVNATRSIANIENRELFNTVKGLFVAALTIYGKCFTSCEGRRVKLEKKNLSEDFHETHDEAMAFRHNFAAHSGAKKLEYSKVILLLNPNRRKNQLPRISTELLQPDSWGLESTKKFIDLVEHARSFCIEKHRVLSDKVLAEAIEKGADHWYAKRKI